MMEMDDEPCALEEPTLGKCPLCIYQNDNIIMNMTNVEKTLTGKVDPDEIYSVLCGMYKKHTEPLKRQGKKPMELTEELCREHYTKHVVNTRQQVSDDIFYCCKLQRHYMKNIGVRSADTGNVTLNPHHVQEYVKISRHKLELVKYMNIMTKREEQNTKSSEPHAFS